MLWSRKRIAKEAHAGRGPETIWEIPVEIGGYMHMNTEPRESHIDYVEFPAQSGPAFAAVKRFYGEVFGWSFKDWGEEYSDTKDSGLTTGISAAAAHRPASTLVVLFTVDLEAARERVIKAGGKIVKEIVSFPGGRRFEYIDPAGNRLGVWSDK